MTDEMEYGGAHLPELTRAPSSASSSKTKAIKNAVQVLWN